MLLATGFMRKVFETFEAYQTPIDMITTSEVGVSMSIDNDKHLTEIVDELKKYGFEKGDTEGFVNYGLSILGVEVSAFFIEDLYEEFIKISFRSKKNN